MAVIPIKKKTKKTWLDQKRSPSIDNKIRKSLWYSILDASFYSAMLGFGESFLSAFAVFLRANNIQLGLLGSLPQTLGSLSQLFSERLLKLFKSRKNFVCTSAFLHALMYIPIALAFFIERFRVEFLILFVCLYFIVGMIAGSAWSSWMGDLVSEEKRGSYFSKRNTIAGLVSFITLLLGGYLLQISNGSKLEQYIGFAIIFTLALLFRITSFIFLTRKYEPTYNFQQKNGFSFFEFIKKAPSNNYGLFILFLSLMNFSIFIAGPFFTAYMLYDLRLNYLIYTIVLSAAIISKYLSMPTWGKLIDLYGTKKVLTLSAFLMPLVPLLWIFSPNVIYLIIIQLYSGFVWAGFETSSFTFLFDTIIPQRRAKYIAYSNVLNGIALFIGALLGGVLVRYNNLFWSKYMLVFIVSTILRYTVSFIFIPKLKEVRNVEKITYPRLFFSVINTMSSRGLIYSMLFFKKKK